MLALSIDREWWVDQRRRVTAHFVDTAYTQFSRATGALPPAHPELHGVERVRDLPYAPGGLAANTLDVWRPRNATGPLPIAIYIHGGAFRALSKDTHWLMGLLFARKGYLCFNLNYRLAPTHRYPTPLEDVSTAYQWILDNAKSLGGDPNRMVIAGESAGANLSLSLALSACYQRPEPWAQAVYQRGVVPKVVAPFCGVLQVSDPARFSRRKPTLPTWLADQIEHCSKQYLPDAGGGHDLTLADPLLLLENERPDRPLPAIFSAVGTRDPVLDDTRRLKNAAERHGTRASVDFYPGEIHAFHALVWRQNARKAWRRLFDFAATEL